MFVELLAATDIKPPFELSAAQWVCRRESSAVIRIEHIFQRRIVCNPVVEEGRKHVDMFLAVRNKKFGQSLDDHASLGMGV